MGIFIAVEWYSPTMWWEARCEGRAMRVWRVAFCNPVLVSRTTITFDTSVLCTSEGRGAMSMASNTGCGVAKRSKYIGRGRGAGLRRDAYCENALGVSGTEVLKPWKRAGELSCSRSLRAICIGEAFGGVGGFPEGSGGACKFPELGAGTCRRPPLLLVRALPESSPLPPLRRASDEPRERRPSRGANMGDWGRGGSSDSRIVATTARLPLRLCLLLPLTWLWLLVLVFVRVGA